MRNMKRNYATLMVTFPDDLISTYLDNDGNFFFNNKYLEEEDEEEEFNKSILSQEIQIIVFRREGIKKCLKNTT